MCRILIIEDNKSFRQFFKELLINAFPYVQIEEAENGGKALQKLNDFLPHLIFMDIKLPDTNGLTLTKNIHATHPEVTIVVLTSYNIPEYRDAAYNSGARYFLAKASSTPESIKKIVITVLSEMSGKKNQSLTNK